MVAANEDRETGLVKSLASLNVPSVAVEGLQVDFIWTAGGEPFMADRKTVADLIASAGDERLHNQVQYMREAGVERPRILLEGSWSRDGVLVGPHGHEWSWEEFDSLCESLQEEGVIIIRSSGLSRTPYRLATEWRRTGKEKTGSWHVPAKVIPTDRLYFDRTYRSQIGGLMSLPDCGPVTANNLRECASFMEVWGITEEGLATAKQIWNAMPGIGQKTIKKWEEFIRA